MSFVAPIRSAIRIAVALFALHGLCVSAALAQSDTQPPRLIGTPEVSPDTLVLTGEAQTITISAVLEDDDSGVASLTGYFFIDAGGVTGFYTAELASGTAQSGTWVAETSVSEQNLPEGPYTLIMFLQDAAGNVTTTDVQDALYISGGDANPPELVGDLILEPDQIVLSGEPKTVVITATISDAHSGVSAVAVHLTRPDGGTVRIEPAHQIDGSAQLGTWRSEVELDPEVINPVVPDGDLEVRLYLEDVAGNVALVETGAVLRIIRTEALVTFSVDVRGPERLGMIDREFGFGFGKQVYLEITDGPNAGAYEMQDFVGDSLWSVQVQVAHDQTLRYRYAIDPNGDGIDEGDWVYEKPATPRTLDVEASSIQLPTVPFDGRPAQSTDPAFAALSARAFRSGASELVSFDEPGAETLVHVSLSMLSDPSYFAVRRYTVDPGGAVPTGIATRSSGQLWILDAVPFSIDVEGVLTIDHSELGGIVDPSALRLLRRTDSAAAWEVAETSLDPDEETLSAPLTGTLGEWTIGSTSAANSLVPQPAGAASSPQPADGAAGIDTEVELSWTPGSSGRTYDVYLWTADAPEPDEPIVRDLTNPHFTPTGGLQRSTDYVWYVVTKNLDGETPSARWTFSTTLLPDLAISDVVAPATGFSGQEIDLQWTVTNVGTSGTDQPVWYDQVSLSSDPAFLQDVIHLGAFENVSALPSGEAYIQRASVRLPQDASGVYLLRISANRSLLQPEADAGNNESTSTIEIEKSPTGDLRVASITAPANTFSGQAVDVEWTVTNLGDAAASSQFGWTDNLYFSPDENLDEATAHLLGSLHTRDPLAAGESYTAVLNAALPARMSGEHYFIVVTDANNAVFEGEAESNNTSTSDPISITLSPPPDLAPTSITVPSPATAGEVITVSWRVENQGPGAIASASWQDQVLLSAVPALDRQNAVGLAARLRSGSLLSDSSYTAEATARLPDGIDGAYWLFVDTDWTDAVFEYTFEDNNALGSPISIERPPYPDLAVTQLEAPNAARAGDQIEVRWSVRNEGDGSAAAPWTDRIYLSESSDFDTTAVPIARLTGDDTLRVEASYARRLHARIPHTLSGALFLHVVANADNDLFEFPTGGENNRRSQPLDVESRPPADLAVTNVVAPADAQGGETVEIRWTVENPSNAPAAVDRWDEIVYLSTDRIADPQRDVVLAEVRRTEGLGAQSSYERRRAVTIPQSAGGPLYVLVQVDDAGAVPDGDPTNNTGSSANPISVQAVPPPNLVPAALDAPSAGVAGQPITVSWTVRNEGPGALENVEWSDAVYLSADGRVNLTDLKLAASAVEESLQAGDTYEITTEVGLPYFATGSYYLLLAADDRNTVYEGGRDSDNVLAHEIHITLPPPSDLVVSEIIVPDVATPGEETTISWTIENRGSHPAQGMLRDAVYVSPDAEWEIEDPLLGTDTRYIDLSPGESMAVTRKVDLGRVFRADAEGRVTSALPGLAPGAYHAIVRVDIQNNIREEDETNNTSASSDRLTTEVPVLALGESVEGTLIPGQSIFYRVPVPAGVETFELALTSGSPGAASELFVRAGEVPTRTVADVRSREPFSAESRLYVPAGGAGETDHYVLLYGREGPEDGITFSLSAEEVSFELERIDVPEGGSGGEVTVKMEGAAFGGRLRALLENEEHVIEVRDLVRVSAVEAYATFDLTNAPFGRYDFVLERNESYLVGTGEPSNPVLLDRNVMRSILPGAFRVVRRVQPEMTFDIHVPEALRVEQSYSFVIEVTNRGNVDRSSPLVLTWTDPATRTSLHRDADRTPGRRRIVMAGPAPLSGILRPGATHRVLVDAEAPEAATQLGVYVHRPVGTGLPFDFDEELARALLESQDGGWIAPALDLLRKELASGGWREYEIRLAEAASAISRSQPVEPDGARLLLALLRREYQQHTTPSVDAGDFIGSNVSTSQGAGSAPAVISVGSSASSIASANEDCSSAQLAEDFAFLEGVAAAMASPICDGYNGARHLQYFLTGTPDGVETVVYDNNSSVSSRVRQHTDAYKSFESIHEATAAAIHEEMTDRIRNAGCRGPAIQNYTGGDVADLGVTIENPNMYLNELSVGVPYYDPREPPSEFNRKHSLGCDMVTAFGGFQSASGRLSNLVTRRISDPVTNECTEGCTIVWEGVITYEFGDNYEFDEADAAGAIDARARNLQLCGAATPYKTKVILQEPVGGIVRVPPKPRNCRRPPPPELPPFVFDPPDRTIPVVNSLDPNDIVGPAGYGDEKWVSVSSHLPYKIRFENDPELATAPAQSVSIVQEPIDSTLDIRSFRLGRFGFGDFAFDPPENVAAYVDRLDLTDTLGILIDVNAGLDVENNRAFWILTSIDPATSRTPANPFAGFLPVNDSLGSGEGFVSYTIRPSTSARTGDVIHASADIVFDNNPAITTPEIFNTVDAGLPQSRVLELPAREDSTVFEIRWTSEDDEGGSGLRSHDLYVSKNFAPFELYQSDVEEDHVLFNGEVGSGYRFYTLASDRAGNLEPVKNAPDAAIRVDVEEEGELPERFSLDQNYPNPFNPTTTIPYALPRGGEVELDVYNVLGQRVLRYKMGAQRAGRHQQRVDMSPFASGVYFYELRVRNERRGVFREVKKFVFVK